MKRFVAFALVLVLLLSCVAVASAGYYPHAKFKPGCKNITVKYGKNFTVRHSAINGSGPFYRVYTTAGWKYRAKYDLYLTNYSRTVSRYVNGYQYSGDWLEKHTFTVSEYGTNGLITKPKTSTRVVYKLILTTYYRATINGTVYGTWYRSTRDATNLYVKR